MCWKNIKHISLNWKLTAVGALAGLGLYEYMLLNEELGAEPIWVINNGLSHEESIPTARIQGLVQDALDSIEFITGGQETQWGRLRAQMGHPEPWSLTYIGVGNEVTSRISS